MTTVFYDKVNVKHLIVGDIVELIPNTRNYGEFQSTIVENIDGNIIHFARPFANRYGGEGIRFSVERYTAYRDHKGLFYSVSRNVELYENQIVYYTPDGQNSAGIYRLVSFYPINPDTGMVKIQPVIDGERPDTFSILELPEYKLNWTHITDWNNPDILFFDPKDNKIKQYYSYQPKNVVDKPKP